MLFSDTFSDFLVIILYQKKGVVSTPKSKITTPFGHQL